MKIDPKSINDLESVARAISDSAMELTERTRSATPEAIELAAISSKLLGSARQLEVILKALQDKGQI